MFAVYRRELCSFFSSMVAYVYISFVLAFIGIVFTIYNLSIGHPHFSYALSKLTVVFIFTIPILTMRSIAAERKSKTDQMLLTAPISVTAVVMGKFFSTLTVFVIPLIISCFCPLVILTFGSAYPAGDYAAIFSFVCLGAMLISVGMYISSLTENQMIAAVITFGVMLVFYLWDTLVSMIPVTPLPSMIGILVVICLAALAIYHISLSFAGALAFAFLGAAAVLACYLIRQELFANLLPSVLSAFSLTAIIVDFTVYNVFNVGGLFFYLSVSGLFLFLTAQNIQKRRWS